jgi:hypothetical protein
LFDGLLFLFFFSLYLLTYPIRLYYKHKHKQKSAHKSSALNPLVEKTLRDLEYDYGEESTAEIDLEDEV